MKFFSFGLADSVTPQSMGLAEVSPDVLGGKGAGLAWMSGLGVPVPPGFVIGTDVWAEYDKKPKTVMKEIAKALPEYLQQLEQHFGYMPLLSVRSGSRVSCPGMMDTILNVGLDFDSSPFWVEKLGPECYADSLHRLVTMYGSVVKGIRREDLDANLSTALKVYVRETGDDFPDTKAQLLGSIEAVFKSWDNERAKMYRKMNAIPRTWGTAVTVQAMVFGNLNEKSGTGVLFTRHPDTGAMTVTGEFLVNAQGEDVVAGVRTPVPLTDMKAWNPTVYDQLLNQVIALENNKRDMQDVEFTVQDGQLFVLQTRSGKRSATAAIRIALDMVKQELITSQEAVRRVSLREFDLAQMARLDPAWTKPAAFKGISACSGVVSGKPVFTKEAAIECKEPCILITKETTPDDIEGMYAAVGVVTMVGGLTSHAAVVARSMNRACIVGVGMTLEAFGDVETVSMDGATGRIWVEKVPIIGGETLGLISQFSRLVFETLDVVPVLFEVPTEDLPQALLYLGDRVLDRKKAVDLIAETALRVSRLYVDLTVLPDGPEAEFFALVAVAKPQQQVVDQLQTYAKTATFLQERVVILGNVTTTFKMLGAGTDLRTIVLADELLSAEGLDATDPAIQKVLAWKKADGLPLVSLGKYVAGRKSILSVQQAMQVLAEGVV